MDKELYLDAIEAFHRPLTGLLPVFVRSAYNYDRNEASVISGVLCMDESMTVQSEKDSADINIIVERFGVTGMVPVLDKMPVASEFDAIFDYQTAQNAVVAAREAFAQIPAKIRTRFENDPGKFLEFYYDKANKDELVKMGLAEAEVIVPPVPPPA